MHLFLVSVADLLLILVATAASFMVREDFDWLSADPRKLYYVLTTLLVAAVVNSLFRVSKGLWRYSNFNNAVRIVAAVATTVTFTVLAMFWIYRLDGVARTIPLIQLIFATAAMLGGRLFARLLNTVQHRASLVESEPVSGEGWTTLVVGVTPLAQLYLRALADLGAKNVSVAGLIGLSKAEMGRGLDGHRVIGLVEDLPEVLRTLEVHGVFVSKIVVAERYERMRPEDVEVLEEIEKASDIDIEHFADRFDFLRPPPKVAMAQVPAQTRRTAYAPLKRLGDAVLAGALLIALAPAIAAVALLVAVTLGRPILFWQRRPGLHGKNFRLYKFRTLGPSHDEYGAKLDDDARMGFTGKFLRHTRLDELPQLFNILIGDMSFVGPRPLLPVDQPARFLSRLDVRPGLTGWAQVNGGRLVSAEDKGAMDVWYVRNMSFALDVKVAFRTVPMILHREKLNDEAVTLAWRTMQEVR